MTTETKNENNTQMMTMTGNDAMMQTLLNVPVFEQMQRAATLSAPPPGGPSCTNVGRWRRR